MGPNCHYAHGVKELRKPNDPLPDAAAPPKPEPFKPGPAFGSKSNYKTVLCKYFAQGSCKNADKCSFAHGPAELRGGAEFKPAPEQSEPKPARENPEIITKQLDFIIQKLTEMYQKSQKVTFELKNARQLLQAGNYKSAADALHQIMHQEDLAANASLHDEIIADAKRYGEKLQVTKPPGPEPSNYANAHFDKNEYYKSANNPSYNSSGGVYYD